MKKIAMIIGFLLLGNSAMAACTYNGKKHSEGTVIGPYVCSNGKWVKK